MRRLLLLLGAWVLLAVPTWFALFLSSQTSMVVAGHESVVRPTFDHQVRLETGPYLPDLRMPSDGRIGVRIAIGKTTAQSTDELVQRYALIANRPEAEVRAVTREVKSMAVAAALRAALFAAVPIVGWELLGPRRRHELFHRPSRRALAIGTTAVVLAGVVVWQPWRSSTPDFEPRGWVALPDAVPELDVPAELRRVQVQGAVFTQDTKRLIADAFGYYDRSKAFYERLVDLAPGTADRLHQPEEGQTVALLVSDRHDNIGMDAVVHAVAEQAGASAVIDAGDDTSAGQSWEAFSLESLDETFDDYDDHLAVSGNHDHGKFVSGYLSKRGWTHLDHRATEKFGVRFYGIDDPRASGLGAFIPVKGPSFEEERDATTEEVCDLDDKGERVASLIVHDAALGRPALERGCVDLVVAGHLHVQVGPERVVGSNGKAGYTYTNGTTGGAAFAVAVGGKLRREAEFTFVTYADGRPVGIQPVRVSTHGELFVDPYVALQLD